MGSFYFILGVMTIYVRNLEGEEYTVQATTKVDNEINGNQSISGDILHNQVNELFIKDIERLWEIYDHDDVGYKILTLRKKGIGDRMKASFTAIPLFDDYMNTHSIMDDDGNHYKYDGSMTAYKAFSKIFDDTPFDFVIVDDLSAVEWENFGGGEPKLETFKRCLERYKCEFRRSGNTIYLEKIVSRKTSIQYRHRLNASDIVQEIDASEQYTAIKGYGNYGESQNSDDYRDAKLIRDYVSPLAAILGKRYSPPVMDGRLKNKTELDNKLEEIIEESLKISVTANIHQLAEQEYPIDKSQAGDFVFVTDDRIEFDEEVRIVSQSITKDYTGKIIDANVTFGSEGLGKRYQSNLNTAVKNITDVFEGRKEVPLSSLDKRVQEISKIINGNTDSIFEYNSNGVIGWNGDDPNYMTRYVGDAIGFSKDGGETYGTAMSAELGIVADYITTGTLRAILVEAVDIYGSYIEGTEIVSKEDDDHYIQLKGAELKSNGIHKREWFGETSNDAVTIGFRNGQLRARNHDQEWSLFFNDWGISTFSDGDGNGYPGGNASGAFEFHSYKYADFRGLTIMSYGRIALESSNEDGARMYLNPNGANVHVADADDNYHGISASKFNQSSSINQKHDIKPFEDDALDIINSLQIKEYKRKTSGKQTMHDKWQVGILVEEAHPNLLADSESVDIYSYLNHVARGLQQYHGQTEDRFEVIEKRLSKLEGAA